MKMTDVIAFGAFCVIALYILYVIVMHWKSVREEQQGKLTPLQWAVAGPALLIGYPLDIFVNIFVATVVFLDVPQETTVTARLQRYLDDPRSAGWRIHVAEWFKPRLNKHDPDHLE